MTQGDGYTRLALRADLIELADQVRLDYPGVWSSRASFVADALRRHVMEFLHADTPHQLAGALIQATRSGHPSALHDNQAFIQAQRAILRKRIQTLEEKLQKLELEIRGHA